MAKKKANPPAELLKNASANRLPQIAPRPDKTKSAPVKTNAVVSKNKQPNVPAAKPKKRAKKQRKSHATRPTAAEIQTIAERQALVSDLRKAGATIRQISEHLLQKGYKHASPATVFEDLEKNLTDLNDLRLKNTDLLVTQELDKIDDWEFSFYRDLKNSANLSVDERIKIGNYMVTLQNQRDKFLRISKPQTIRILTDDDFAKALGIEAEQLPDGE